MQTYVNEDQTLFEDEFFAAPAAGAAGDAAAAAGAAAGPAAVGKSFSAITSNMGYFPSLGGGGAPQALLSEVRPPSSTSAPWPALASHS